MRVVAGLDAQIRTLQLEKGGLANEVLTKQSALDGAVQHAEQLSQSLVFAQSALYAATADRNTPLQVRRQHFVNMPALLRYPLSRHLVFL